MITSSLTQFCDRIIRYSFFLLFSLVPLLLTTWNSELFEYNKMMAVYLLTAVIGTAWAAKSISQKELRLARTPLDIPIVLFVLSQLVSTIFSMDPHVSWLGYYSRFNGGMWSIVSYAVLYWAFMTNRSLFFSENQTGAETKKRSKSAFVQTTFGGSYIALLNAALICASLVAIYGVLERLGIDKHIWVQDVQNRVFSTMGQPNWLAAYLVALLPLSIAFAINKSSILQKSLYSLLSILFFAVLLFTRSKSGIFAFAIADVVLVAAMTFALRRQKATLIQRAKPALILHLILAVIVFVNGTGTPSVDKYITYQGITNTVKNAAAPKPQPVADNGYVPPALEVGGTDSGVIRNYVWQGAINAWRSSTKTMLIGTGTETFAFAFYQHRPVGHNKTSEWDFLYNKAHNEYLNFLATTGALGLTSYLLFIGVFVIWFVRKASSLTTSTAHVAAMALFAGWVSLLITNFFGFSVVIGQVFLFVFPALCLLLLSDSYRMWTKKLADTPAYLIFLPVAVRTRWLAIANGIVILLGLVMMVQIWIYWYADTLYAQGYRSSRAGQAGLAVQELVRAIALNPSEPVYHDELSGNYASLAVAAFTNKNATQAAQLSTAALKESSTALEISPKNVNFWKTRTKVYYTLSGVDPSLNGSAIEALKSALALSPNDPKIYYNLAILTGRSGDLDAAMKYLEQARELKSDYRDVYYALSVFYAEMNKKDQARAILQEYLNTVDAADKDFQERLKTL